MKNLLQFTEAKKGVTMSRDTSRLRNASREHLSSLDEVFAFLAAKLIYSFSWLRTRIIVAGSVSEYVLYLSKFGKLRIFSKREKLWRHILNEYELKNEQNIYFEFGVAWGYLTFWWTKRIKNSKVKWHGFDRFTGLPRKWEALPEGAFSANGETPQISDARITWHVGDVEETIFQLDESVPSEFQRRIIFFDLDIYEPTNIAYTHLKPFIRKGDILYFDEARMADEWKLFTERVVNDFDFKIIGITFNCLALEILSWDSAEKYD
jgi:hypothetical protein